MRYLLPVLTICLAVLAVTPGVAAEAPLSAELARRLSAEVVRIGPHRIRAAGLRPFYEPRDHRPLWKDGARRAGQLLAVLRAAGREGLDPADYAVAAIAERREAETIEARAELELLLTRELLRYASDLRSGRMAARKADPELYLQPGRIDRRAVIESALESRDLRDALARLAPANPAYRELRRVLARYRQIAERGGWPRQPRGRRLEEGMTDRRVKALRRRLALTGDLASGGDGPALFDAELTDALRFFQRRHGLEVDGVLGPRTRAALNLPVEARIARIVVNMERWRWVPDDLGARHVMVNLAAFELAVVEDGWNALEMQVVIGRPYRRTPVFASRITHLEFNPTWTVPLSIAGADFLPRLREDPGFLRARNIRVFDGWDRNARELDPLGIDWTRVTPARFPYMLRQDPGRENALGRVKFMLPNPFKVYLHDTPADGLFSRRVRTFSSGCIRLERPFDLATYLLKDDPDWSPYDIDDAVGSGETIRVVLPRPIPVYLTYATVWTGRDGAVHFRDDVYGRDALLARALFGAHARGF